MFIISLGLLAPFFATAQEEQTTQQTPQENEKQYPATIEGQYDQLVEKAGNWEKYKLIKKESIYSFKRFMLDSLKAQKQVLREKLDTISSQSSQIKQLNQRISSLESDLDKEKNRNNSIEFLGMTIENGLYSAVVWGIIIILAIFLAVFVSRFSRSNSITRGALKDLESLQNEYEEYRTKAIEREQKVRRQLQDEINKHRS